jgi:hypothetical protein
VREGVSQNAIDDRMADESPGRRDFRKKCSFGARHGCRP